MRRLLGDACQHGKATATGCWASAAWGEFGAQACPGDPLTRDEGRRRRRRNHMRDLNGIGEGKGYAGIPPRSVLRSVALPHEMVGRLTAVIERIRHLHDIGDDEASRAHLKSDLPRLRRAILLNNAARLALASGVCTALLLAVGFGSALLRLQHVYGAAALFLVAVVLLGAALFRFGQEVRIGLSEADHYR